MGYAHDIDIDLDYDRAAFAVAVADIGTLFRRSELPIGGAFRQARNNARSR